jgi:hypothetical protein
VVPPTVAGRWLDALLRTPNSEEAIASVARQTGDAGRDLPPAAVNLARKALEKKPELLSVLEGDQERDLGTLGRVFGEELPAGLVFADERA